MCVLCICLFVLYVLVFVIFPSSWRRGLAAVCDCGTPWTFLLTFLQIIWTGIKSRKSSNSGQIGLLTLELLAL